MRFFFYGTLLDPDVTALVLGRRLAPGAFRGAVLPGHARRRAKGASYPIVVRDQREQVHGAIVEGLSPRDVDRLAAYEGPGYRIATLRVQVNGHLTITSVFEPMENRLEPSAEPWELGLWQRRHKRAFVKRLQRAFSVRPAYSRR